MNAYLNYLIEANIGLVLFLVAYTLILRNETDFKSKRMFLIVGILASLTFPLFHIQFSGSSIPSFNQSISYYLLPEVTITAAHEPNTPHPTQNGWFYLPLFYFLGLAFFFIRFAIQLIDLIKTISNSKANSVGKFKIVEFAEDKPTFSFFNFIFVGQANILTVDEKQKIILHETVHSNQLHSLDILLLNMLGIFFWFNPLLKNYKKIFIQLHEFEADARATENRDVNEYCSLLAKVALQSTDFPLCNHFNNSLTLKRIEMMKTIKRKIRPWKMLVIASVIPLAFFIMACQDENVFTAVDETAMPEGGMATFYEHVGKKIKYPLEARQKGIQGKVFVEFIIKEDGSIDVTGISGIGAGCDLEAMMAVQSAPKWLPGKMNGTAVKHRIVFPISFRLGFPENANVKEKFVDVKNPEGAIGEVVVVGYKEL